MYGFSYMHDFQPYVGQSPRVDWILIDQINFHRFKTNRKGVKADLCRVLTGKLNKSSEDLWRVTRKIIFHWFIQQLWLTVSILSIIQYLHILISSIFYGPISPLVCIRYSLLPLRITWAFRVFTTLTLNNLTIFCLRLHFMSRSFWCRGGDVQTILFFTRLIPWKLTSFLHKFHQKCRLIISILLSLSFPSKFYPSFHWIFPPNFTPTSIEFPFEISPLFPSISPQNFNRTSTEFPLKISHQLPLNFTSKFHIYFHWISP